MKKVIFVTGSHRSGSTWIGRVLSATPHSRYIHEPFNISPKLRRSDSPFKYHFEYISNNSDLSKKKRALNYVKESYNISLNLLKSLLKVRSPKELYYFLADVKSRILSETIIIKDPMAIMSAIWLHETLNAEVIVSIRHPAAFVASLKVQNWNFNFSHFLSQEDLMEDYLKQFKKEIEDYSLQLPDIVKQGILLWNIMYTVINKYEEKFASKWHFVKHESLSQNPLPEFKSIFNKLDIDFDDNVKKEIIESTTSKTNTALKRDSASIIKSWKDRLTPEEIELIKRETYEVWRHYYSELDW
jgi:hypothetical protein